MGILVVGGLPEEVEVKLAVGDLSEGGVVEGLCLETSGGVGGHEVRVRGLERN